jgi:hypothetical protein
LLCTLKKQKKPLQLKIEDVVLDIQKDPTLGEAKLGDLKSIFAYKYKFNQQEYLIAYQFGKDQKHLNILWIDFYKVGSHENFYDESKRYLKEVKQ